MKSDIRYLLINPPLTDPTTAYHSISYLVGSTLRAGYANYSCLDANVEALNYLTDIEHVQSLLRYCENVRAELEKKSELTREEQIQYRYALMAVGLEPVSVLQSVETMRDPNKFYDYSYYRKAVITLKRWLNTLSVQGFAGQFNDFSLNLAGVGNFSRVRDLTNASFLDRLMKPFLPYFEGPFTETILRYDWDLVGFSTTFTSQLPFTIFMSKIVKSLRPQCLVCAGGTEITDDAKYAADPTVTRELFSGFDAIVVGEGETALVGLLDSIRKEDPLPKNFPGIVLPNDFRPSVNYEDLTTLPSPIYDIWDWNQYWSPEPVILYSPTRGCYWNRCTFCDYGLNTNSPTSPSRQRPIEIAISEIKDITKIGRTLYFAVDAISPAYLRRLSEALIQNGVSIRWSAELRLERLFQTNLTDELRKGGCVCISFGYESGCQRILNLIDKGLKVEDIPRILKELSLLGIGSQMMGFIGFPTETSEEAHSTFEFLKENRNYWSVAAIGDFVLTSGAIVAKRHKDFGISKITRFSGDDIIRYLCWVDDQGIMRIPGDMRSAKIQKISQSLEQIVDDRPFVGGIDSSHTILYFAKYGSSLVLNEGRVSIPHIKSSYYVTPFMEIENFVDITDLTRFRDNQLVQEKDTNFNETMNWLQERPSVRKHQNNGQLIEIQFDGHFTKPTHDVEEYEKKAFQKVKTIINELIHEVKEKD